MANREIVKVSVRSDYIRKTMQQNGISFRNLEKIIGVSERRIRAYLKEGGMPPYVVRLLCDALTISPAEAISGNTIWMRIGVTVPVTDIELLNILSESRESGYSGTSFEDVNVGDKQAAEFLKRAIVDGDSYIPGYCLEKFENWTEKLDCSVERISGWVARYDAPGRRGLIFKKGCFNASNNQIVPVVDDLNEVHNPSHIIGHAKLYAKDDGLYAEAEILTDELSTPPKSFGFYANRVRRYENKNKIIESAVVITLTTYSYEQATSRIEKCENVEKGKEQFK